MANIPAELKYTKSHEWLKEEDGLLVVGLTDFAANALGDIVFINLPQVDDEVTAGESFADVESVKAVSDVFSPVSGTVEEVNDELLDAPEMINEAPSEAIGTALPMLSKNTVSKDCTRKPMSRMPSSMAAPMASAATNCDLARPPPL